MILLFEQVFQLKREIDFTAKRQAICPVSPIPSPTD
jgi:hypothetical protein